VGSEGGVSVAAGGAIIGSGAVLGAAFLFGFAFFAIRLAFFFAPFFVLRFCGKYSHRPIVELKLVIKACTKFAPNSGISFLGLRGYARTGCRQFAFQSRRVLAVQNMLNAGELLPGHRSTQVFVHANPPGRAKITRRSNCVLAGFCNPVSTLVGRAEALLCDFSESRFNQRNECQT
jgi:hypothetical protein